jgi:hypothetical protein
MFANRVLAAVACCVLLACAPARADDPKPMKPPTPPGASDKRSAEPKFPTVIPLEVLEPGEAAVTLAKGCGAKATFEPLPDEKALLVYADAKTTDEIRKVLRLLGEPLNEPKRAHVIPVPDVFEFDDLVKTVKKLFPVKTVLVPLKEERAILAYVTGVQAAEIRKSIRLLSEPAKPTAPPPMSVPRPPGTVQPVTKSRPPAPKTFTVYFKDAKWDDVFAWYAKETGLTLITAVKPKGTFTFTPPKDARFTVAEFTDAINDALAVQKFILIRRHMTFFLHDWTEKLEPRDFEGMFARIALDELSQRGRTELVRVVLPLGKLNEADAHDEVKKMLGPFGSAIPLSSGVLVVSDTVGNILRIRELLTPM